MEPRVSSSVTPSSRRGAPSGASGALTGSGDSASAAESAASRLPPAPPPRSILRFPLAREPDSEESGASPRAEATVFGETAFTTGPARAKLDEAPSAEPAARADEPSTFLRTSTTAGTEPSYAHRSAEISRGHGAA